MYRRDNPVDFRKAQQQHPNWPVVFSEGDSWFSHAGVVEELDNIGTSAKPRQRPWALLRLERAGDEILTILSGGQRARLRSNFARGPFDALLFSGGGNDIIGADLLPLLRSCEGMKQEELDKLKPEDLIAYSRFERRIRQVQDCYRELLDLLSDANQSAKVFVHSYDYVVASDRPVKLLGIIKLAGPWLWNHLESRRIPTRLHTGIVKLLIDGYVAAIDAVASEPRGVGRLIRVETRNLIQGDWEDEIHPNRKGARKVADAFEAALLKEGVLK